MPRYSRKFIQTSFLHIIVQGINKSFIFKYSDDIYYYLNLIQKYKTKYDVNVIAYCIMGNHAHMLLKIKSVEQLSEYMHKINSAYGRYYNKKYKRVGYVFRDRYKSEQINNEKHLYNCIHYIYNNPVAAGICQKPEEYPYSNYRKLEIQMDEEGYFIDTDEDIEIIFNKKVEDFIKSNNTSLEEIKNDEQLLKAFLKKLKQESHFSYDRISKLVEINKGVLYRLLKQA